MHILDYIAAKYSNQKDFCEKNNINRNYFYNVLSKQRPLTDKFIAKIAVLTNGHVTAIDWIKAGYIK